MNSKLTIISWELDVPNLFSTHWDSGLCLEAYDALLPDIDHRNFIVQYYYIPLAIADELCK